jgi:hypothetical protein
MNTWLWLSCGGVTLHFALRTARALFTRIELLAARCSLRVGCVGMMHRGSKCVYRVFGTSRLFYYCFRVTTDIPHSALRARVWHLLICCCPLLLARSPISAVSPSPLTPHSSRRGSRLRLPLGSLSPPAPSCYSPGERLLFITDAADRPKNCHRAARCARARARVWHDCVYSKSQPQGQ